MVLQSVSPLKEAKNSFMTDYNLLVLWFPRMHDQTSLTLIFKMGLGGYCKLFCLSRRPKIALWLTATYRRCDFLERIFKHRWSAVDTHFQEEVGRVLLPFCLSRQPILQLCTIMSESIFNHQTYMTYYCWRSVNAHFATAVSTICNHLIWHSSWFKLFWRPFWCFHLLSSWSLCCSIVIHRYI